MVSPKPQSMERSVACAVLTTSDTRTVETDKSGQLIQITLRHLKHRVVHYQIVPDDPELIEAAIAIVGDLPDCQVILLSGGTGIGERDCTCEVVDKLLDKRLPGFGEIFRALSYQEVGSRAIASRSVAGIYRGKLIFALPGSEAGVKLALEKLILPELLHLTAELGSHGHHE
ncbi:MAG: MogA/MoaB family molybdenum cofactor biosynthesis protein [Synechocystis sp.]|nr:MogA/MoaB family molybdenum cofactor biosynthesis protein [Synechocystis sp.]